VSESKQLTLPERAALAVGAAEHEKHLMTLAKKYSDITRIANVAGRDQVHAGYMELKNARVAIEKAGKDAREDANAFQKAVIEEVKRLTAITTDEEARLQVLRDEFDAEREREKQAKAAAEKARVDGIRNLIDEIKTCPAECVGRSAAEIQGAIDTMTAHQITLEEFAEFSGEAEVSTSSARPASPSRRSAATTTRSAWREAASR
jgi:FtsZ-binding cell division protein ZapB